jgi:alpha-tubulin suppressor-like RCC1 family protein
MPNQFFFYRDDRQIEEDIEDHFATDYWLFEQFIGDQLWAWGSNEFGKLGTETTITSPITYRSTPRQEFTSSTNWRQVSCGRDHSLAIKTDGTLWAWGYNNNGQIGNNTLNQQVTPIQIGTATNWKQVAGGESHSLSIKTDGTLWAWGDNLYGQLGDNTTTDKPTPIQEFTLSKNWKQVTAGDFFSVAIKTDGTLWAWGYGLSGRLGDNTVSSRSTPRQIGTATNWKQVDSGDGHTTAVKTDGTLWTWGSNSNGQIGDNTTVTRSTPTQVGTATNWRQVSAGNISSSAIKTDGTLWNWGSSLYGQAGDNTSGFNKTTPVQEFTSSTTWKQVSVGSQHIAAIKTDGTLWSWGRGFSVGDNTTTSRSTPRQEFTSSTNWKQVANGYSFTLAIKTGVNLDMT